MHTIWQNYDHNVRLISNKKNVYQHFCKTNVFINSQYKNYQRDLSTSHR